MSAIPWILIGVLILLILFAIIVFTIRKKEKRPMDYYNFFIIGIIWIVIGVPLKNWMLSFLGVVFAIVGLMHKKEWKKNRQKRDWSKMSKSERTLMTIIMIFLAILVILGLIFFFISI